MEALLFENAPWRLDAACRTDDASLGEIFFSDELQHISQAKAICTQCPVMAECLEGAIARREPWGVWGGQLFRNGKVLEFTYPSRTIPVGASEPYKNFTEDPVGDLKGQGLAGESLWLGVDTLPTLQASN